MEIQEYLKKKKNIQKNIITFIESENDIEEHFQNLIQIIDNKENRENLHELQIILSLINKIASEHHRTPNFFSKIERILLLFKNEIKKFSNSQIFELFKKNKRLLLFLFDEKILQMDEEIALQMKNDKLFSYSFYFFNEIKSFLKNKNLEKKILRKLDQIENLEQARKEGENENEVCQLIRQDSIEKFIVFINKNNFSISTRIEPSIFETNPFLIDKKPSLLEYSAFFGSIQIFKYLYLNKQPLTESLWLFAIHGQNPEIINVLEESKTKPKLKSCQQCLAESIKCHHIEMTEYIRNNFLSEKVLNDYSKSFKYFNFIYFPENLVDESFLYYSCKYNYVELVKLILKNKKLDVNAKTISHQIIFLNKISNIFLK